MNKTTNVKVFAVVALIGLLAGLSVSTSSDAQSHAEKAESKDYIVIEGVIKRSMALTMSQPGEMQANPPDLTLVTDEGKKYPVRRIPGCTGGPATPSGGVIKLGSLGRYRCKGVMNGTVFEVYEMTKL